MWKSLLTPAIVGLCLTASGLTTAPANPKPSGKIAQAVSGKLVKVDGKKVKNYTIQANPRYYVLYHSAGW